VQFVKCWFLTSVAMLALQPWLATSALAADAEFVGVMALVVEPDVAKELGLSEDERNELLEWVDDRELSATDLVIGLRDKPEQREAKMAAFVAESEKLGLARLSPARSSWRTARRPSIRLATNAGGLSKLSTNETWRHCSRRSSDWRGKNLRA
jgi:hypothetical protein